MTHKTHTNVGVLFALVFNNWFYIKDPIVIIIGLFISILSSLMPDIDLPHSWLGHKVKFISKPINAVFGHRTITHSFLGLIGYVYLFKFLSQLTSFDEIYIYYAGIGYFSHLLIDAFNPHGVPFFYPFSKWYYHFLRIRTNSSNETFFNFIVMLILLWQLWLSMNIFYYA